MSIIHAIIILNLLIGVHELGHFLASKACGVEVEEFSLGMGPKMISKKIGTTVYSVRWILLGGYVKMNEEEYLSAKLYKQIIIISAGVIFNLIFAILGIWLYIYLSDKINVGFFGGILFGIKLIFSMIGQIFEAVINIFKTADTSSFTGPAGVVTTISTIVQNGFIDAVEIFTVLNLNLFVMNLLPIPMLDGGQIVLTVIKGIFKKKEMPKFETIWNTVGLIALALIFIFAMRNDIVNIFIK